MVEMTHTQTSEHCRFEALLTRKKSNIMYLVTLAQLSVYMLCCTKCKLKSRASTAQLLEDLLKHAPRSRWSCFVFLVRWQIKLVFFLATQLIDHG